ncbi:MAG: hypothetical protein WAK17_03290 [Candidatus Nitrosopolaris sp.]
MKIFGTSVEDIEKKVIKERMSLFNIDHAIADDKVMNFIKSKLLSERGEFTANKLLLALKKEKIENETANDFEKRLIYDAKSVIGFSDINK